MKDVRLHRLARQEMAEVALKLDDEEFGLGERFIDALERTFESIGLMPEAGFLHERGTRIRMAKPFSYGVLYRIDDDAVRVLAIGHLSRSPEYWTQRIEEVDKDQPD